MPNNSFSQTVPNLQLVWDQTSLGTLQFCPRRYYYEIILGRVPRKTAIALTFGKLYHEALAEYDKTLSLGYPWADAVDEALKVALAEADWTLADKYRNRDNLIRSIIWYADQYQDSKITTLTINNKPAIELSFRFIFGESSCGETFLLAGHFDGVVEVAGVKAIRERKTTVKTLDDNYFSTFSPNIQITTYAYAAKLILPYEISQVLLDCAQVAVGFTEFAQRLISRHRFHLAEYELDVKDLLRKAEHYALTNYWPKHDRNCWLCPFRDVCSQATPDLRSDLLEQDFVVRTWDPSEDRE